MCKVEGDPIVNSFASSDVELAKDSTRAHMSKMLDSRIMVFFHSLTAMCDRETEIYHALLEKQHAAAELSTEQISNPHTTGYE